MHLLCQFETNDTSLNSESLDREMCNSKNTTEDEAFLKLTIALFKMMPSDVTNLLPGMPPRELQE